MKYLSAWLFLGLLSVLICGCSRDGLIGVSGQVLCNGAPLEDGGISFTPVDQAEPIYATKIINGKYNLRMLEGKMVVRIYGRRFEEHPNPPPRAPHAIDTGPVMREVLFLPSRYNTESTLTAEVSSSSRKFDFTVEDDGEIVPSLFDVGPPGSRR